LLAERLKSESSRQRDQDESGNYGSNLPGLGTQTAPPASFVIP
jgi:hypothetical protein